MKEDIKLPAILRDVNTSSRGESNQQTVLMYKDCSSTHICGVYNGQYVKFWDTNGVDNITAEYLANTYGEVKSKEHAEFIKLLAETNDIPCSHKTIDEHCNFFYVIDGGLFFSCSKISQTRNFKQITIPLPPECETKEESAMKNVKLHEKTEREKILELMHECYHENGSDFYDFSQKFVDMVTLNECESVDEWPKVGDDANVKHHEVKIVVAKPDSRGFIVVKTKDGEYSSVHIDDIQKPKTPEQELRDEVVKQLEVIIGHNLDNYKTIVNSIADSIVNNKISGFDITKKPQ